MKKAELKNLLSFMKASWIIEQDTKTYSRIHDARHWREEKINDIWMIFWKDQDHKQY